MNTALHAAAWLWLLWRCKGAGVARAAGDHSGHRLRNLHFQTLTSFHLGGVAVNPERDLPKAPRPTARTEFFPLLKLIKTAFSKWSTGSAEPALAGVGREGLQREPIRPGHRLRTFLFASAIRETTLIDGPAQRAAAIKRRKQIWEAMHPEQKGGKTVSTLGGAQRVGFAADTATAAGLTKQSINQHLARATAVEEAGSSIADLAGTSLDKGTELDAFPASGLHG
jgi:hypothetical protein